MLKGKAIEVYDRMSVEDLEDYEEFKADILRVYELRSEACRLQFRRHKKSLVTRILIVLATSKGHLKDGWLASVTFHESKELMVSISQCGRDGTCTAATREKV